MLTVLPFCQNDKAQAIKVAQWIAEMGGVQKHTCMLVHPPSADAEGLLEPLQSAFSKVYVLKIPDDSQGWPNGANLLLRRTAVQIQHTTKQPWLWLEPDAIPLVPDWLDWLETAYNAAGRPFMGALVRFDDVPPHMSGIAIYPGDAPALAPLLVTCDTVAFDVASRSQVLPQMHETPLIQHEWRPKPFAMEMSDLKRISPAAVIFHQDKTGSLIPVLRQWGAPGENRPERILLVPDEFEHPPLPALPPSPLWPSPPAPTDEEQIQHHVSNLKSLAALSPQNARLVAMYLAAESLGNTQNKKQTKKNTK